MSSNDDICVYKVVETICNELKILNPVSIDETNYPCLISVSTIIDPYTFIDINGTTHNCHNVSIYHSKTKSIIEPTEEEINIKLYDYDKDIFIDDSITDDCNMIFEVNISKKSQMDNVINMIKNALINLGYNLDDTNEYILK